MIQRQQTLWLLLSAITSFLTFEFPFYSGEEMINNSKTYVELDGASTLPLLLATGLTILIALITIFIYKDRKNQVRMAIAGIILSLLILLLYFLEIKEFLNGHFALTSVFALITLIGFIMAARGIWKDQKLVKSLDKLR